MNVLSRASKYLVKKKSKSLIILFLFIIVATVNLVIVNLNTTIGAYYQQMSESTTNEVVLNRQMNMNGGKPEFGSAGITDEDIQTITSLDYVTGSKQSNNLRVTSDLDLVTVESSSSTNQGGNMPDGNNENQQQVVASSDLSLESDIVDETVKSNGNVSELANDEIMISQALAEQNDLEVGDTVKLTMTDRQSSESTSYSYKVGQIYTYSGDYDNVEMGIVPDNTIYMNLDAASNLVNSEGAGTFSKVSFFINDINDYQQLKNDVFSKLDISSDDYTLDLNDEIYTTIIKPLETAVSSLQTAKNIIIIIALIIIGIFIMLSLKERMYEVSVYYSLGASKKNIISQFILENLILYTIATIVAIFISGLLTEYILSSNMISNFTQQAGEMSGHGPMGGGAPGGQMGTTQTNNTEINLSLNPISIGINYLITTVVIMILNLGLLLKVLRKNPREIMMDK